MLLVMGRSVCFRILTDRQRTSLSPSLGDNEVEKHSCLIIMAPEASRTKIVKAKVLIDTEGLNEAGKRALAGP